jgi:hypothetical protein
MQKFRFFTASALKMQACGTEGKFSEYDQRDNCISIRKKVLYLFYNIAQRNIKKEILRCFRVDTEL